MYVVGNWPWPTTSGVRLRAASLADRFADRFDLTLIAADRPDDRFPAWSAAVRRLRARARSKPIRPIDNLLAVARGRQVPLEQMLRAGVPDAFADVLAQVKPAIVVLGRPFFDAFVDRALASGARVITDADENLERSTRLILRSNALPRARLKAAVDVMTVGRMQRRNYPRVEQVWVTSQLERRDFVRFLDADRVRVIPQAAPGLGDAVPAVEPIRSVAYVGWYHYAPNEAAAVELIGQIMPAIRAAGGPRRLTLIGRDPSLRMRRLAAATGEVEITGEVPDVIPPLRSAGVLVVPLRSGAGTRLKILEAMAAGVPVVSTSLGYEGLELEPGSDLLVAETAAEFADALARLTRNEPLRRALVENALSTVRQRYSPAAQERAILDALGRAAS